MANEPHFGTVTKVKADKWGVAYTIKPDKQPEGYGGRQKEYVISDSTVTEKYDGTGMTRIVHIDAYNRYRREQLSSIGVFDYQEAR